MPKVSVIILTYNRKDLLEEALNSVFEQSFEDYEVIVLDDGSSDGTDRYLGALPKERLTYKILEHSGNIADLRNEGVRMALGEFIAFLDSDDVWLEDKLERQVRALEENPELAFCFSEALVTADSKIIKDNFYQIESPYIGFIAKPLFQNDLIIYPSSTLLRRSALLEAGPFPEEFLSGEIYVLAKMAWKYPVYIDPKPLVNIRKQNDNFSSAYRSEGFGYKAMLSLIDELRQSKNISKSEYATMAFAFTLKYGQLMYDENVLKQARNLFIKSMRLRPLNLRAFFWLLKSLVKRGE